MSIKMTDEAAKQIKQIVVEQNMNLESVYIRVGIKGKSCSGNVYAFGFDEVAGEDDEVYDYDGLRLIHDKKYSSGLENLTIDFKETEEARGFTFKNPSQSKSEEGCCNSGGCCGGGCS